MASTTTKVAAILGIVATFVGIVYKIHDIYSSDETKYEKRITDYETKVRAEKIKNKGLVKSGDSICIANLTHHKIRVAIKYNALDGNWLLEGTVPFDTGETNYIDSYTNNGQVYINIDGPNKYFYNNQPAADTVSVKVTKAIPYAFLVGDANPYRHLADLKLYGATLDDNNTLLITDHQFSDQDFKVKRDSINALR